MLEIILSTHKHNFDGSFKYADIILIDFERLNRLPKFILFLFF